MRLQQFFCSLLVALLACKDVMGAPPEMGNRVYEGDRIYEGNLARYLQALQQIPPPDAEYLGLLPRLSPRYNTGNDWADQREPAIYLLPEPEEREVRKRVKPSLSIVNSLDVLRRRVLLDMIRRQESEKSKQAEVNRQILQSVGKRAN